MKSSGFNSIEQEEIAGYEPVDSGIKFDTQDDELERIINLGANAVKGDIQKKRDKNKENLQEEQIIALKPEKEERKNNEILDKNLTDQGPVFKFGQNIDFDNLPALKPLDGELLKKKEQAEPIKFDESIEHAKLEAKNHELSENLQAINEALSEIDALDETLEQKKMLDETEIAEALEQPGVDKAPDTKFNDNSASLDNLGVGFIVEEVDLTQGPSEKDQILDFFQNEFNISQNGDNKEAKDESDIIAEEVNLIQSKSNLNVDFWNTKKNTKIDEFENLHESQEQVFESNLTQAYKSTSKGATQVQVKSAQESGISTTKEAEARPAKRKDRAALLAEIGLSTDDSGLGMPGDRASIMLADESARRVAMKGVLDKYLIKLIELGGSDLHVKSDRVIRGRFNGEIFTMGDQILDYDSSIILAKKILGSNYYSLMKRKSVDFTYRLNDDYRFRSNVFLQMDGVSFVFRTIPTKIPTMSELLLPPVIERLCSKVNRGIILVTGPTGSGKTTTLASMINYLNHTKNYHIVTIEDPIEFIYNDDKSVINQRGIGQDVDSFADALRASLREDPDVIFVGEMRDLETVRTAINAAETGHLVLATLHTLDAKETIGRVINMFPKEEQNRIRMTFASVAEAIISQRLVVTAEGKRRVACEVMIKNIRIRDMILEDRDSEIYDAIEQSKNTYGMQTFEQHLLDMYTSGIITKEEALKSASRRENLDIKIKSADLAKKRAMVASIEEDAELLKEFQSEVIALKDIK